jgi:hypothetical protein
MYLQEILYCPGCATPSAPRVVFTEEPIAYAFDPWFISKQPGNQGRSIDIMCAHCLRQMHYPRAQALELPGESIFPVKALIKEGLVPAELYETILPGTHNLGECDYGVSFLTEHGAGWKAKLSYSTRPAHDPEVEWNGDLVPGFVSRIFEVLKTANYELIQLKTSKGGRDGAWIYMERYPLSTTPLPKEARSLRFSINWPGL